MMNIKSISGFKNPEKARAFFSEWHNEVMKMSGTNYDRIELQTPLGTTIVWGINSGEINLPTLIIFPGFRTCSMFWDMDNALEPLKTSTRIFMVDTNGQPSLSEGKTPEIKSNDYGVWAAEILRKLSVTKATIAGASFGALISLKLCLVAPELVDRVILLNPGCLQTFSLSMKNIYYNFLPLISPSRKNVEKFLDNAVFFQNKHMVSDTAKKLIIDYEVFAIKEFRDKTQKPYAMSKDDLESIKTEIYLILGDKDILFPYQKSRRIAEKHLKNLKEIFLLSDTGHGIETSKPAISIVSDIMRQQRNIS